MKESEEEALAGDSPAGICWPGAPETASLGAFCTDREDSESESETDEDEEGRGLRKDFDKAMIKPGKVAESLRKDGTVKTPVNLQLESVKETEFLGSSVIPDTCMSS